MSKPCDLRRKHYWKYQSSILTRKFLHINGVRISTERNPSYDETQVDFYIWTRKKFQKFHTLNEPKTKCLLSRLTRNISNCLLSGFLNLAGGCTKRRASLLLWTDSLLPMGKIKFLVWKTKPFKTWIFVSFLTL